jgi:hypothetical protein
MIISYLSCEVYKEGNVERNATAPCGSSIPKLAKGLKLVVKIKDFH